MVCPPEVDSQMLVAKVNASEVSSASESFRSSLYVQHSAHVHSQKVNIASIGPCVFHMGISEHKRECTSTLNGSGGISTLGLDGMTPVA